MSDDSRLNVPLVGEESAGVQTLQFLSQSDHDVVVVLASATPVSRGPTVRTTAERMGIRVSPAEAVKQPSFADSVREHEVDLLRNVPSLYLIWEEVLAASTRLPASQD